MRTAPQTEQVLSAADVPEPEPEPAPSEPVIRPSTPDGRMITVTFTTTIKVSITIKIVY